MVRDVRENGVQREAPPILYLPLGQMPAQLSTMVIRMLSQSFLVRTPGDTAPFTQSVPREIQAVCRRWAWVWCWGWREPSASRN